MKKILILTSKYLPQPSANGLNTHYIVKELIRRGNEVHCISVDNEYEKDYEMIDGIKIHRVSPSLYTRLLNKERKVNKTLLNKFYFKIIRFFRKLLMMLLILKFPNFDLIQSRKIYRLISTLNENENFDCIIAVHKPYFNLSALNRFKMKNDDVICGAYYLDLVNSSKKPTFLPNNIFNWLCYRADIRILKHIDFALIAKGGESIYKSLDYNLVRNKISFIDFPTFNANINKMHANILKREKDKPIKLMYAGTLDLNYRNPEFLLKCLSEVSKKLGNIQVDLFGGGNCGEIINNYANEGQLTIIQHGYKSHQEIIENMVKTDFLINVSNKIQNAVPSKIFELFSTAKPIINLVLDKRDVSIQYFNKYPSVFSINEWNEISEQVDQLMNYIISERGKEYDINIIKENFEENTPEFTVNLIERYLSKLDKDKK